MQCLECLSLLKSEMKIFLLSQAQGQKPSGNKLFYLETCLGHLMEGAAVEAGEGGVLKEVTKTRDFSSRRAHTLISP